MKQRTLVALLIIETVILAFVLLGKGTSSNNFIRRRTAYGLLYPAL